MDSEKNNVKTYKDPPESKPRVSPEEAATAVNAYQGELEERSRQLQRQEAGDKLGKKVIGICRAKEVGKVLGDGWTEVVRDRREAERERKVARLHLFERDHGAPAQQLLTAWKTETQGWHQIEVVLDSGAADSVCPKDTSPRFAVEDSESSRAGVF